MSSNVDSSKALAAIGALLLFISFVPIVGIIGIILLLIGMKGLSEYYKDESIYRSALRGLIFGIIGIVAVSLFSVFAIVGGMFSVFTFGTAGIIGGILGVILILVVAFVFYLLMAINFRRAFDALAERSGEHLFHTAGTLLFVGAILTIVLVGLILVWIAWIIAAIAFFSMRVTPSQPSSQQQYGYIPPPPPTAAHAMQATRYCYNCNAPQDANATFCSHCGKQVILV
ncbi:MAG: DUF996 domain-containing protein [Ignavibacteria bacterium]